MKPQCIAAVRLLHLKFILCHFNELYFNFFIWVICLNFNANFVA